MPLTKRWKPGIWIARVEEVKFRSKRRKKRRRAELFRQKKKLVRQHLLALAKRLITHTRSPRRNHYSYASSQTLSF
jgi:hypothetical protein